MDDSSLIVNGDIFLLFLLLLVLLRFPLLLHSLLFLFENLEENGCRMGFFNL